jgi:hypothetical protein
MNNNNAGFLFLFLTLLFLSSGWFVFSFALAMTFYSIGGILFIISILFFTIATSTSNNQPNNQKESFSNDTNSNEEKVAIQDINSIQEMIAKHEASYKNVAFPDASKDESESKESESKETDSLKVVPKDVPKENSNVVKNESSNNDQIAVASELIINAETITNENPLKDSQPTQPTQDTKDSQDSQDTQQFEANESESGKQENLYGLKLHEKKQILAELNFATEFELNHQVDHREISTNQSLAYFETNKLASYHNHPEDVPTNIEVKKGDGKAMVYFKGVPNATFYSVIVQPYGRTINGWKSPILIPDLHDGIEYTFSVKAHNQHGYSRSSNCSMPIQMKKGVTKPNSPQDIVMKPGNGSVTVHFKVDSDIQFYSLKAIPGNYFVKDVGSPIAIGGLTNGVLYTISIQSHNSRGSSDELVIGQCKPTLPMKIPLPPANLHAKPKSHSAEVYFTEIENAVHYTVTTIPGNVETIGVKSPIVVTNLENNVAYTFTITATNEEGTSIYSLPSEPIKPTSVEIIPKETVAKKGFGILPEAPLHPFAIKGNGFAMVKFDESLSALSYTVTSSPGSIKATGLIPPITIDGLENGVAYTFTVTATNKFGMSYPSKPSNEIIPTI